MSKEKVQILLVDDEAPIADTVAYALETEGFAVLRAVTLLEAETTFSNNPSIALIVLDVGLPDGSGFEFCKKIRQSSNVLLLFLTARSSEIDRVVGLEIGADDYVTKPFSPREVSARVKALLRRGSAPSLIPTEARKNSSPIYDDKDNFKIIYYFSPLELSPYEYRLLAAMLERPGRVLSREQLMNAAWEDPAASLERTVDAHIKSIRSKLQAVRDDFDPIVTHRGFGYSIRAENEYPK